MAKMNPPIKFKKVVTGYKTVRPVKGDLDIFISQTEAGGKKAEVINQAGEVVGIVEGATLKDILKRIREGLLEYGVKFPVQTDPSVPFEPTTEIQILTLDPNDDGVFPARFTGTVALSFDGETTDAEPFSTFDNGGLLEDLINSLPGLEEAEVEETSPRVFEITVPAGSPLITSVGEFTQHTSVSQFKYVGVDTPDAGKYNLTDGTSTTVDIAFDATSEDIGAALADIGLEFVAINNSWELGGNTLTLIPQDIVEITMTGNTMTSGGNPVGVTQTYTDDTVPVAVVITQ